MDEAAVVAHGAGRDLGGANSGLDGVGVRTAYKKATFIGRRALVKDVLQRNGVQRLGVWGIHFNTLHGGALSMIVVAAAAVCDLLVHVAVHTSVDVTIVVAGYLFEYFDFEIQVCLQARRGKQIKNVRMGVGVSKRGD